MISAFKTFPWLGHHQHNTTHENSNQTLVNNNKDDNAESDVEDGAFENFDDDNIVEEKENGVVGLTGNNIFNVMYIP